jgi:hypothetical protein
MEAKPKMVEVTDRDELAVLTTKRGDLECPWLWTDGTGRWWADPHQLSVWRSQHNTEVK